MYFDGAANEKGAGIGAVIVSNADALHYPIATKLKFDCTNNMAEYEACIIGLEAALDMNIEKLIVFGDSLLRKSLENGKSKTPSWFLTTGI